MISNKQSTYQHGKGGVQRRTAVQLNVATVLPVFFFLLAFGLLSYRLTYAPDLLADEALYASVGNNIAAGRGLVENSGISFVWHPPLYMLLEAAYLKIFRLVDVNLITQIYQLRYLNVIAAALTAVLLFLIGRRLRGTICGTTIALLFCLDPYIQRINRRSMLETIAVMLFVLGIWLFMRGLTARRRMPHALAAGAAFGLAGLTKEFLMIGLLVLLVFVCWYRRDRITAVLTTIATGFGLYTVYPIWIYANGQWPAYAGMKERQLIRLVAKLLPHTPTPDAGPPIAVAKVSLWDNIIATLPPYICSYIIIVAGGVLAALLITRVFLPKQRPGDEYLLVALWMAILSAFVGTTMVFGSGSDQLFYLMIVPGVVLVGVALSPLIEWLIWFWFGATRNWRQPKPGLVPISQIGGIGMLWLVLLGSTWNITTYVKLFAIREDNSYAKLYDYIHQTIPPGTTLIAGSDLANYLFPDYQVRFERTAQGIEQQDARYVILSSKERWGGYGRISPVFYDWVVANSDVRFTSYGTTFWDLQLFELKPEEP